MCVWVSAILVFFLLCILLLYVNFLYHIILFDCLTANKASSNCSQWPLFNPIYWAQLNIQYKWSICMTLSLNNKNWNHTYHTMSYFSMQYIANDHTQSTGGSLRHNSIIHEVDDTYKWIVVIDGITFLSHLIETFMQPHVRWCFLDAIQK